MRRSQAAIVRAERGVRHRVIASESISNVGGSTSNSPFEVESVAGESTSHSAFDVVAFATGSSSAFERASISGGSISRSIASVSNPIGPVLDWMARHSTLSLPLPSVSTACATSTRPRRGPDR
jgi:hypothetical protein